VATSGAGVDEVLTQFDSRGRVDCERDASAQLGDRQGPAPPASAELSDAGPADTSEAEVATPPPTSQGYPLRATRTTRTLPPMRASPAVYGLQVHQLIALRDAVEHEAVTAVRQGADSRTLRDLGGVLDEIDSRLQARSAGPDRLAENRSRVADTKRPTMRGIGRRAD
jgi:hypothetical protein